jgi:hypothetical protein
MAPSEPPPAAAPVAADVNESSGPDYVLSTFEHAGSNLVFFNFEYWNKNQSF